MVAIDVESAPLNVEGISKGFKFIRILGSLLYIGGGEMVSKRCAEDNRRH